MPSGRLPLKNAKFGGKFALVNLQPIKLEKKADLVIHSYVDDVLEKVLKRLGIEEIPEYDPAEDPTKHCVDGDTWNVEPAALKEIEKVYKEKTSRKTKSNVKDEKPDGRKKQKIEKEEKIEK
jgi:NAD+-dependent protein deacetylase sirtuin 6